MDSPLGRRDFLRTSGAGLALAPLVLPAGLAAASPALAAPVLAMQTAPGLAPRPSTDVRAVGRPMPTLENDLPDAPDTRVGYAVVGLGRYALNQILPSLARTKNARLVALVSGNSEKRRAVAEAYGVPSSGLYDYSDFDRIADNPAVQVVYVITPPGLHREFSVRASRAGKHVLCEKPMANTVEECEEMIQAARTANRLLMIGYRVRYEPYNQEAIAITRERRELGTLRAISTDHGTIVDPSDPSGQWRPDPALAGGGALFDIGVYGLQAARYLTGEEPTAVSAFAYSTPGDARFTESEERIAFNLQFPGGVTASCAASFSYNANRVQAFGDEGSLDLQPATSYYSRRLFVTKDNTAEERLLEEQEGAQFASMMDHFAECVRENRQPLTPGEEGLQDVRIMLAIYEAARTGQTVQLAQASAP